jgi:hypothetical protein
MFHAPSFGDEDFELTTSSSCVVPSSAPSTWTNLSADGSSTLTTVSADNEAVSQQSSSPLLTSCSQNTSAVTEPDQNSVYHLQYCGDDRSALVRAAFDVEYSPDRKYVTPIYRSSDGHASSPTSLTCHNNNNNNINNNENNFRSNQYTMPTSHSTTAVLKHYDAREFPSYGQTQHQSAFEQTVSSVGLTNHRSAVETPADQLQIAAMQYDGSSGTVVPAGTGYNGSRIGSGRTAAPMALDDGGCCRSGSVGVARRHCIALYFN